MRQTTTAQGLRSEIETLRATERELQQRIKELQKQLSQEREAAEEGPLPVTTAPELERTLGRWMKRVAMILQADKAAILLYDPDSGLLMAQRTAVGFTEEQLQMFRLSAREGIGGEVFRGSEPLVVEDAVADPRTAKEFVGLFNIRNMVCVPLTVERKDDEQRVLESSNIGIVYVFNKRFNEQFIEEDIRLLAILARQAAAIISSARLYLKVAEEKRQLEATVHSIMAGLILINQAGRIILMNRAARELFEVASDHGVGKEYEEVISDAGVRELFSRSLESHEEMTSEISLFAPHERIFQAQTAPVRSDGGDIIGMVAVFNDITEIRSVEQMKTAFVSTVSHELRTPLTSIKGFVSTLLEDKEGYFDKDTQLEFYQIIDSECDRLTRLINDLLNVSRIEAGRALEINYQPFNLVQLAKRVIDAQRTYATSHELTLQAPETIEQVIADPDKLDQVLTNLVSNAIKYSPRGGEVTVAIKDLEGFVEVSVHDQGIGIPENQLDKIFERFHRVEDGDVRQAGGTGIGLYLVKHLVESHGGSVWAESALGKGSTFTFRIPKAPIRSDAVGATETPSRR